MSLSRQQTVTRARVVADLPCAVARDELTTYFQPQIDIASGRVVALEGLSRWQHPHLGTLLPDLYIPVAEESDLMHELGSRVLDDCCQYAQSWHDRGRDLDVAVNVSPAQLSDIRFFDDLDDELERSAFDTAQLILEITETGEIDNVDTVAPLLDGLRERGVAISIDDFGAGESSPQRVVDLRATELKLDRELVHRVHLGEVEAVIQFAHRLGVRVVGEGVETDQQLSALAALGCDRAQGYFIAGPAPREQWEERLTVSD